MSQLTNQRKRKTIRLLITVKEFQDGADNPNFKTHREWVQACFMQKNFVVTDFTKLKFFYLKKHLVIEGVVGDALLAA